MTPAKNKVFLKARTTGAPVPVRLDVIDTAGYVTSQAALTKVVSSDDNTYEFDFSGVAFDGGYGGPPCETGPCPVDLTAISQMLLYVNAEEGGFADSLLVDFLSVGQPLAEDRGPAGVINYYDQMDENTALFVADAGGYSYAFTDDTWTITGDGTAGAYTSMVYTAHDDMGEEVTLSAVGSMDKLYVRARSTVDGTRLRIDLQDQENYVSNAAGRSQTLTTDYTILEYDYNGGYNDGGYGGSPCETGPCPIDGERIKALQLFINDAEGAFSGDVIIDWLAFGEELETTAIQDIQVLSSFRAFPNPTTQNINLDFDMLRSGETTLTIINMVGQVAQRAHLGTLSQGAQRATLSVEQLISGVYMAILEVDGKNAGTIRFVKQ